MWRVGGQDESGRTPGDLHLVASRLVRAEHAAADPHQRGRHADPATCTASWTGQGDHTGIPGARQAVARRGRLVVVATRLYADLGCRLPAAGGRCNRCTGGTRRGTSCLASAAGHGRDHVHRIPGVDRAVERCRLPGDEHVDVWPQPRACLDQSIANPRHRRFERIDQRSDRRPVDLVAALDTWEQLQQRSREEDRRGLGTRSTWIVGRADGARARVRVRGRIDGCRRISRHERRLRPTRSAASPR